MNRIYLDNAATTSLHPDVLDAMLPFLTRNYGNASGVYETGREARKAVEAARRQVAGAIGAKPQEIYFTSGGTEADNMAILGIAEAHQAKGRHIITSSIEHPAVHKPLDYLEKQGFEISVLPVDAYGVVDVDQLEQSIRPDTILISIMAANNEVGTIQDVERIGQIARNRQVLFHTDAVQAVGTIPVEVDAWQADLLSLSGHKFHGPKGAGALYVRKGVRFAPLLHGGNQEKLRRAGTENVAAIVGLGAAIERACLNMAERSVHMTELRNRLSSGILGSIKHCQLNGHPSQRLPGNVNVSIAFIEGEALLLRLDLAGIAASSGSACSSGSLDPSHVLLSMGLSHETAHGSLRFSLSEENTAEEVDQVLAVLPGIVKTLRDMSPLYDGD